MLTVICGPMFSGKTAELIRLVRRDRIGGRKVQLFKFEHDARYAQKDQMASMDGVHLEAVPVDHSKQILTKLDRSCNDVVIDEAQFFDDGIIDVIRALVESRVYVKVAGLTLDFRGEAFPFASGERTMADLLVSADKVVQLSAVCTGARPDGRVCGNTASRTQRLIDGNAASYDSPVHIIGAAELYEARCFKHHEVPGRPSCPVVLEQCMLELA
ncbi:MAG: thymidine kinase [Parcubacteria group bacterium]|nr:thymidine kinase [Parcubacteria group bacterium]|tara:strand:- start:672 stop:1313 length:642 start_codon:yes stop_codon:yes gene_type:complete